MVDDILDGGADVEIKESFTNILGAGNGTKIYNDVMKNNPFFPPNVTRLQVRALSNTLNVKPMLTCQVFDAIAAECAKQQVYVHLDNHVSKAGWCCTGDDGNAWFGDTYFDVAKWKRALGYMAAHVSVDVIVNDPGPDGSANARSQGKSWPTLVSMSLRNELRQPSDWKKLIWANWSSWYDNMPAGADAIHLANPDLLIFFSGLGYDSQLRPIFTGGPMGLNQVFDKDKLAYANKIVLEVHDYDADTNCTEKQQKLLSNSFGALDSSAPGTTTVFPLVMSEWGYNQSPDECTGPYASCLGDFLPDQKVGWMTWALSGSYYVRNGVQDMDEPWGLLNHEWKDWRCAECIQKALAPLVNATLNGEH